MYKAWEGLRVIDLNHALVEFATTVFLADLSAEFFQVEQPQGNDSQEYGPFAGKLGKSHSGYFISFNRNQESLVLKLKLEADREILRKSIRISDMGVMNAAVGVEK